MVNELWWEHLCPAMANISPLKDAQSKLMKLGVDYAEAGRILSEVHKAYVDAVFNAARHYENGSEEHE